MNASDQNLDALLKASAKELLGEDRDLLHSINTSETVISPKALHKVRRIIKNYGRESWWASVPIACRRAVAAVMVLCSLSFGLCVSAEAVRAEIANTIMEWYDKFISIFYVTEERPPIVIEEYKEPRLQVVGAEKLVLQQSSTDYIIVYFIDGERFMLYQQMVITDSGTDLDSENCVITDIQISGYNAQLFTYDNGVRTITWHDNEYAYTISIDPTDIEVDTIVTIAESIK